MIRVECSCGAKLKADDGQEGKWIPCPKCGEAVQVPSANGSESESLTTKTEYCSFCALGRFVLICGAVCLILGMASHSLVPDDRGWSHNEPKATGKQSILLASIALCVAGSIFRTRSRTPISDRELMIGFVVGAIVTAISAYNFFLSFKGL